MDAESSAEIAQQVQRAESVGEASTSPDEHAGPLATQDSEYSLHPTALVALQAAVDAEAAAEDEEEGHELLDPEPIEEDQEEAPMEVDQQMDDEPAPPAEPPSDEEFGDDDAYTEEVHIEGAWELIQPS